MATYLYFILALVVLALIARYAFRFFIYAYVAPVAPALPGTVRIACIGDSITYGTLVRRRRQNCYPEQLGRLLGEGYSVRNFGANARAMQKAADFPYWRHAYFERSGEFRPDVVLIMLGTNDSRQPNWKGVEPYLRDYRDMLTHYSSLPCRPLIYALTPPTEFVLKHQRRVKYGMIKEAVDEMTRGIKGLGQQHNIEIIDINAATASHPEHFSFDGVHANAKGARHIAETIHQAIKARVHELSSPRT